MALELWSRQRHLMTADVAEHRLESLSLHFFETEAALSRKHPEICPIEMKSVERNCEDADGATRMMPTRSGDLPGVWKVAVLGNPPPPLKAI